jgi:hypothetical protein
MDMNENRQVEPRRRFFARLLSALVGTGAALGGVRLAHGTAPAAPRDLKDADYCRPHDLAG